MTAPSGLSAQLMLAEESTYGTFVAPTRTYDLVNETMKQTIDRIESKGLRAGRRVLTSQQWVAGKIVCGGDLNLELDQVGFGVFWKHALGTVVTTGSAGAGFTHTISPGDLTGKSLTVQVGRPDTSATIRSYTYTGCKIASWDLACKAGELVNLKVSLAAQAESTAQTLGVPYYARGTRSVSDAVTNTTTTLTSATAAFNAADVGAPISTPDFPAGTYIATVTNATTVICSQSATAGHTAQTVVIGAPAMGLVTFVQGTLTVAGVSVPVRDVQLKGNNALDIARYFLQGAATIKEPLEQAWRDFSGTFTADFTDLTLYGKYTASSESALVLTFTGGAIPGAGGALYTTTITLNVRYDGNTANVAGPQILTQPMAFKAISANGLDSGAITVAYLTSDATP